MKKIYCDLEKILIEKKKTIYWLQKETGIAYNTLVSYKKNKTVRFDKYVLEKICNTLKCEISELILLK